MLTVDTTQSQRMAIITHWLQTEYKLVPPPNVQLLAGDAGARNYYRCYFNNQSYVIMDAALDPTLPIFLTINEQLQNWGLHSPQIYNINKLHNIVLMSDLGNDLYLTKLTPITADALYKIAIDALLVMQRGQITMDYQLPLMNNHYIAEKLAVFKQWFLIQHLNLTITEQINNLLIKLENLFNQIFMLQPQVFVHVDYHSRNLLVLPDNKVGILDFQDARIGPITYDLVSLLQDAYIAWPQNKVELLLKLYYTQAKIKGSISDFVEFVRLFDLTGLQRHLKNLGVFARLHYHYHKSQYLNDIPMLLQYIRVTCRKYSELAELAVFFDQEILPRCGR